MTTNVSLLTMLWTISTFGEGHQAFRATQRSSFNTLRAQLFPTLSVTPTTLHMSRSSTGELKCLIGRNLRLL